MLFLLKNLKNEQIFYLINKEEFIVGRKDCDFLIQNDVSVSRKHGLIRIKDNQVTLIDSGSKYKTCHNNSEISPNVEVLLKPGDEIQFGVYESKFRFEQYRFVTTGTRLNHAQKEELKEQLAIIGGHYTETWHSQCTHLTVQEITMTIKILHALLDNKPIVMPSYWTSLVEKVQKNKPLPPVDEYEMPPMAEALLNKIEIKQNISRKELFQEKLFVFLKENSKRYMEDVIRKAGGVPISWEKEPMPLKDISKSPKQILLIETPNQEKDRSFEKLKSILLKDGKRTIPQQEIALAIVLGSCQHDCNPSFKRTEEVFRNMKLKEPTQNNVLVHNTESQYFSLEASQSQTQKVIADTLDDSLNSQLSAIKIKKCEIPPTQGTKREPEENCKENVSKKIKIETENNAQMEPPIKRSSRENTKENPFKRFKIETPDTSKQEIKNEINQSKRKAEEDLAESGPVKRNPFTVRKKIQTKNIIKENPFTEFVEKKQNSAGKQNTSITKIVSTTSSKHDSEIFSSTRVENKIPEMFFNCTKIPKISSTIYQIPKQSVNVSAPWISKESLTHTTTNTSENHNPEMQSYIEQFKNKVQVEIMATPAERITVHKDESISRNGIRNFKRFRKVKPLHPQTTMIGREHFKTVGPYGRTGTVDVTC